ncbi:uncharacterized protein F5Z01DRAFT_657852 [Emericellopsis atlantica]|uniref:DUF676 domain-containing protein n=1 Tax=Emericellopsis atlantica TaxID=2614577 RepID=A0A9P8CNZ2_9HYPO|nr:uncharacterized protein F5Z01DRAFT_657852 [Emericellopsis atlantica]KAG9253647.1 hypothetical protein F5Z01DRAFT_657852 [Emericellopsis atlantica]
MTEPGTFDRYAVLRSYEPRDVQVEESSDSAHLGQRNSDDHSTRSVITHLDAAGLGIIGRVLSVVYGTWHGTPATLVSFQFRFRSRAGSFRFRTSEIAVTFDKASSILRVDSGDDAAAMASPPAVVSLYPKALDGGECGCSIKGSYWLKKNQNVANQVYWKIRENNSAETSGLPDQVGLCVVVTSRGPFLGVVEAEATLKLAPKAKFSFRNLPWSKDDPLLFDGRTGKGPPMEQTRFDTLTDEQWAKWIAMLHGSLSFPPSMKSEDTLMEDTSSGTSSSTEQTGRADLVYRIRGIPASWSEDKLVLELAALFSIQANQLSLLTFARSAFAHRSREAAVAVVSFLSGPPRVLVSEERQWSFSIPGVSSGLGAAIATLVLDRDFEGLTPLGRISPTSTLFYADIIAVPGVGGHAYGSFKERGRSYMWLQDSLPVDLRLLPESKEARVLIYGYDSHLSESQSFQSLWDLGGKLQATIRESRSDSQPQRPIVLIAHSLGGLVVREAIIRMSRGNERDRHALNCIAGAMFFGVPNKGMDITSLIPMVGHQPNRPLLDSISSDSELLGAQSVAFQDAVSSMSSGGLPIFSIYETLLSPTAVQEGSKWRMAGTPAMLVDRDSATHGRPLDAESRFVLGLNRNHSDLVKFERNCDDYELVLGFLKEMLTGYEVASKADGG